MGLIIERVIVGLVFTSPVIISVIGAIIEHRHKK